MRWFALWLLAGLAALPALAALADGERAGAFDYYVLSLSWSPNWCATEGDARRSDQCHPRHHHGWMLHGLWPQYDRGWPSYCDTAQAPPSPAVTAGMADIMGSAGLARYQWKKHGSCSGLAAETYFALARRAYAAVNRPAVLRQLQRAVKLPASVVELAFLQANPGWTRDMLSVTCNAGYIHEARLCLSRDLTPVPCGRDVIADCALKDAMFAPVR